MSWEVISYKKEPYYLLASLPDQKGVFFDEEDRRGYFVFVTPAIDTAGTTGSIIQWFDKTKQGESVIGDDGHDVLDELLLVFQENDACNAKILFPYNETQIHWLTGEMRIHKEGNSYHIIATAHNPYGGGMLEDRQDFEEAIKRRIWEYDQNASFNFEFIESPYPRRQAVGNGNACGVIVAHEIVERIWGKSLEKSDPYPHGAIEIRQKIYDKFKSLHENDLRRVNFLKREHNLEVAEPSESDLKGQTVDHIIHLLIALQNKEIKAKITHALHNESLANDDFEFYSVTVSTTLLEFPAVLASQGVTLSKSDRKNINAIATCLLYTQQGKLKFDSDFMKILVDVLEENLKKGEDDKDGSDKEDLILQQAIQASLSPEAPGKPEKSKKLHIDEVDSESSHHDTAEVYESSNEKLPEAQSKINKRENNQTSYTFSFKGEESTRYVYLLGDFNGHWEHSNRYVMQKDGTDGIWKITLFLSPGKYEFKYFSHGNFLNDPTCPKTNDRYQNSLLNVEDPSNMLEYTFTFPEGGGDTAVNSVHVAGTFNDWLFAEGSIIKGV